MIYELIHNMDELAKKVTKATNPYKDAPVFKEQPEFLKRSLSRGGSVRGGGGGGSYACACAGCACAGCACACAGGGR